ncbi:MAG: hypothetical protein M3N30_06500 [Bacteroidota bacterium]|nr:hypothetical protein [Bacteroidota bacterium]
MKSFLKKSILAGVTTILGYTVCAQEVWPLSISSADGAIIKVYQFQPDSLSGNTLRSIAAISVLKNGSDNPEFGTIWSTSKVQTDRNSRQLALESVSISAIKIPADTNQNELSQIKATLESELPRAASDISLDEILATLDQNEDESKLSKDINTHVPKIIYTTHASVLVTIDGAPILQENKKWKMDAVINSPFTIVKEAKGPFYLYGGEHWYNSDSATGPYTLVSGKVSRNLKKIEKELAKNYSKQTNNGNIPFVQDSIIPAIIVTTMPAELIQTDGEPDFMPIQGTSLLYVENSSNDIFMDTHSQQYYVLISGRWYYSGTLTDSSRWQFVASDKLPADFAKIPEGAPKDNVLASVAGTEAARNAVMDAQMAQTAKVDRKTATTEVTYDGQPQFQNIAGTGLQYAINTASTVLLYGGNYYALDNGVWFISDNPGGPWVASTQRPGDLDLIPPTSPVYNTKFVDIYDTTPDYIYTGFTSGYLNSFIYGPSIVYGTGFYYSPWIGRYYFPRPWSWNFGMMYNPWNGWGFGLDYGFDWFNEGFGFGWGGWYGGWWGPTFYHPAYRHYGDGHRPYDFHGRDMASRDRFMHPNNNIYQDRRGIITRTGSGIAERGNNVSRPFFSNGRNGARTSNNVFSDRQGNVYQRGSLGQWQQHTNSSRTPVNTYSPSITRNLDRQQQMRAFGQSRAQSFQNSAGFSQRAFGGFHGGGGGGFHGGGGGRR